MTSKTFTIRQGDVALVQVASLPQGCVEIPQDNGRIVLAYGESTGHAHAIADHVVDRDSAINAALAERLADAAIKRAAAQAKATLWVATNGDRFLEVRETVHLTHEEHTAHAIPPGIYKQPTQVEYTPAELRRVQD